LIYELLKFTPNLGQNNAKSIIYGIFISVYLLNLHGVGLKKIELAADKLAHHLSLIEIVQYLVFVFKYYLL
jgi:hypothetical protein